MSKIKSKIKLFDNEGKVISTEEFQKRYCQPDSPTENDSLALIPGYLEGIREQLLDLEEIINYHPKCTTKLNFIHRLCKKIEKIIKHELEE
jgi:hypothetical protein